MNITEVVLPLSQKPVTGPYPGQEELFPLSSYNIVMPSRLRLTLQNNLFPSGWRTEAIEMIYKL